nr:SPOR domain-containing protein [uncultured Allomuricauda sp.]
MRLEGYITSLLYDYNCVVVPGFGAFLAHTDSAAIDSSAHRLFPPQKSISFNAQLKENDGLLVSHIAKQKNLGYENLLDEVQSAGELWRQRLSQGEKIDLHGIGKLWQNEAARIQFQPENKTNYLTSSFGFAPLNAVPIQREVLKEEVEDLEANIPFIITPEKREETTFRPWLKYAAILLLAVSLGFTGFSAYSDFNQKQTLARQDAQKEVSRLIQEATFFDGKPLELPAINVALNKKQIGKHHVIAGAFRIKRNADRKVEQLQRKGYKAIYLGTNRFGLHQVAYSSFEDASEALTFLKTMRKSESPDAWLLSEK